MQESGSSLTRILPYKDRIVDSLLIREKKVIENPHYRLLFAMNVFRTIVFTDSYFFGQNLGFCRSKRKYRSARTSIYVYFTQ